MARDTPRLHNVHYNGLLDLREAIHELLFQELVEAALVAENLPVRTVPCYGIVDLGFDVKWSDEPNTRAVVIRSGVVERFADLRLICSEYELSWVPHFLFRLDNYYSHRPLGRHGRRFADDQRPRDLFRRNFHVSFQEDPFGFAHLDAIGPHAVLWGSDYPHAESTFPRSREILAGAGSGGIAQADHR